jgi:hypothetical protein
MQIHAYTDAYHLFLNQFKRRKKTLKEPGRLRKIMHTLVFDSYHNKTYQFKRIIVKGSMRLPMLVFGLS